MKLFSKLLLVAGLGLASSLHAQTLFNYRFQTLNAAGTNFDLWWFGDVTSTTSGIFVHDGPGGTPALALFGSGIAYNHATNTINVSFPTDKRRETYSGTTNSSGLYTVTYSVAFSVVPNVQFQLGLGANNKETILLNTSTTTGCSFYVQLRSDVLGLLPSYGNVNGRNVDVLVTEK